MERARDYSFEALVEVCGHNLAEITTDERGRINAALKQLRENHPDDYLLADLIYQRAKFYRDMYEDATLTPQALSGNWSSLPEAHHTWEKAQVEQANVYAPDTGCETCGDDRLVVYSTRPVEGGVPGTVHAYEEFAPCPQCNSGANVGFWRGDGSRFNGPDPAWVRRKMERREG
jgi:hypothetical protein